ncbi:hypothetical protein EON83_24665 [bacterium]|nr:MAG: hypothetical protein EON83_24665 [bacterium]
MFSILTLLKVCGDENGHVNIIVYTDDGKRFSKFPVEIVELNKSKLNEWLSGSDYIHRRKTCVIIDALDRFGGKIAFIDSDTWFRCHPKKIFDRIAPGKAVFHICEGFVAATRTPFDDALARQLQTIPLVLRSGNPVRFEKRTKMWNTGVIGVDSADRELLLDALHLSDDIWRTADSSGAYGGKIHHAEQFATGYAFRNCRLSEAADCVYHYWPGDAKRAVAIVAPRLIDEWVADRGAEALNRVYAHRYREQGLSAWFDAFKMLIRQMALALGFSVKGARRSVL